MIKSIHDDLFRQSKRLHILVDVTAKEDGGDGVSYLVHMFFTP